MKNLLCIAILSLGIFTIGQAQTLDYYVYNSSATDTWHWAIDDAGPTPAIYEMNIAPGTQRSGTINNFAFPLDWKAVDNNNCYVSQFEPTTVPTTIIGTTCPGTNVKYKIVEIIPFVHWVYKASLQ